MKQLNFRIFAAGLFIVLFLGIFSLTFGDSELCQPWVGQLVSRQGAIEVRKMGQSQWQPARLNDTFCPGDSIRIGQLGRAAVRLPNDTLLRLDELTAITFPAGDKEKHTLIEILKGAVYFFSHHPTGLKVITPFVSAAIEGTEFLVKVEKAQTFLSVFEGRVAAANHLGGIALAKGQSAIAQAGQAPELRIVVRPRDAVQWALYYLPVMYVPPGQAPKEDMSDPRFLVHRASQLLAVGRVNAAGADIERVLSLDPKYSGAFALQSIIALVQNEKDKAFSFAQKAVEAGSHSATAHIAMSYAQQARFDLESARASVEEAVRLEPDNTLAWARLAELWSSFGRLGKALVAAKKAVELNPSLSRTQMVLGFAYLTQVKTTESRTAFEKAIELDQADPLSRLGLGLAKIRDGDLQAGGREIETAASLDPNNSLVRSYLGKVYFEEKRTGLDEREYAIAKELDPNDPTPWFYDAIAKQTTNRPVEALHDLQKAIALNDNRAVYRSRLLLDQDLAVRSASLASIYRNLDFQQLALVEGWNSLNWDPGNHSAHLFLADAYANVPRHEIARTSERLQSQLLQPININPVLPRQTEGQLGIFRGTGPAEPGFNEFTPMFNRNRAALWLSGVGGNKSTWGDEVVVSGLYNALSFSLGQFHYETDGFRDNNDQERNVYNVFAQGNPWYHTSIMAELRSRKSEYGDLALRFDPEDFSPFNRWESDFQSIRVGVRHAFSPRSELIATGIYKEADEDLSNAPAMFQTDFEDDGWMAEVQHIYQAQRLNLVWGGGYFDSDQTFTTVWPPFFPPDSPAIDATDVKHTNVYAYSYIKIPKNVTWTLGASADFFEGTIDKDQFNPKVGATWKPAPSTTLRVAASRILNRTLISQQTIEPTQVAGFNQFFSDPEGDSAWRYGAAVDYQFSSNLFSGLELSKRDIDSLYQDRETFTIRDDSKLYEYFGRAYINWIIASWMSVNAGYRYERFERNLDDVGENSFLDLKTHMIPLGVNFYCPFGFNFGLKAKYVDQEGEFTPDPFTRPVEVVEDSDQFWVLDAFLGYRLPRRLGFVSLEFKNLLDERFRFVNMDKANPEIAPEFWILGKVTLSF